MKRLTTEEFITKAKLIHGDKYDYSLVEYKRNSVKVKIICIHHGAFEQAPNHHLKNHGCPNCGTERMANNCRGTKEEFINLSKQIHNNKFDYSLVEYVNSDSKVKIICPHHGAFEQTPHHHAAGVGCPQCKKSKGELKIKKILEESNINFIPQKTFDDCKGRKNKLPFDFYIPKYNLLIEYQGEQHYMIKEHWGGEREFIKLQVTDKLKKDYCSLKGIRLLEITYKDDVEKVLKEFLCENSPNPLSTKDLIELA
jgi:hypothetical protein